MAHGQHTALSVALIVLGVILHSPFGSASAHGRPAALHSVIARPGDESVLLSQATWGVLTSDDGGETFGWLCAALYGVDARNQDPPMAVTRAGTVLAATYGGLRIGEGLPPCEWSAPDPRIDDTVVIDVWVDGDDAAWALRSETLDDEVLYRSTDAGRTWEEVYRDTELLLDRVRVAPSDSRFVYLSGGIPVTMPDQPRRTFVLSSEDGGRTYTRSELPLVGEERLLLVSLVSPVDPRRVFGQVLHFAGETAPERIVRSDDGGRTWTTVTSLPDARSLAISPDGERVWVGSVLGGLERSDDGGETFQIIDPDVHVRCLSLVGDTLWICGDPPTSGWALARSTDDGETIIPALTLPDLATISPCPRCTGGGWRCPIWQPDVDYDLGVADASLPSTLEGGTGAPRDAGPLPPECGGPMDGGVDAGAVGPPGGGGCACRAGGARPSALGSIAVLAVIALVARARRRGTHRCRARPRAGSCARRRTRPT